MVITDQSIELIAKETKRESTECWSVSFQRPAHFVFDAGDWIDIRFEGAQLRGGKTYSLSSSPTEADLVITFREGRSELKRALQNVTAGETAIITQYGNDYGFKLNKNKSSVLIAGGIGIAPFRSMLKEMFDNDDRNDVMLIYLNRNDDFLFHAELDRWAEKLPNVVIEYIVTNDLNRKKRERIIRSLITNPHQNFYISGPPGMVDATEHLLIDSGVIIGDIRIDSFGGY